MEILLKLLSITLLVFSTQVASLRALEVGQTARRAEQLERSEKDNNTLLSAERSCTFRPELRIDCYPEQGSNQGACERRGCCWVPYQGNLKNTPWCFYPLNYPTYQFLNIIPTPYGFTFDAVRTQPSYHPKNIMRLRGELTNYQGGVTRIKFIDPANKRYEVPIPFNFPPKARSADSRVDLDFGSSGTNLRIVDRKTKQTRISLLQDAPLIFADQFLQLSISMDAPRFYGIGERLGPLMLDPSKGWEVIPLWTTDRFVGFGGNLYGVHPFAFSHKDDGKSSGFAFINSNALQFVIHPAPGITIRSMGGVIDLVFYMGDNDRLGGHPMRIIQQHWSLVNGGMPPQMPPYWSLGFHLCRYGYKDDNELQTVINRNLAIRIPYDVQWGDIDYMTRYLCFTYDKSRFGRLPQIVDDLHSKKMRFVPILDPCVGNQEPAGTYPAYDRGLQADVFIKCRGKNGEGQVWPGKCFFPDFTRSNAKDYYYQEGKDFHDQVKFDGLWIDMNEPANFVAGTTDGCARPGEDGNELDNPPNGWQSFSAKTLCPSCQQNISTHNNLHNLYGYHMAQSTHFMLTKIRPNERPFILTRSSYMGSGVYTNKWTGDTSSSWEMLTFSIPSVVMFGFFGVPMVGADICGFQGNPEEELCVRWTQVGAFYGFMRNHNDKSSNDKDPAVWSGAGQAAMREVTELRYSLLPHLYTLYYRAHVYNELVLRPLFFVAPTEPKTFDIDKQFMWGDGLLITPVLQNGWRSVTGYFPATTTGVSGTTVWYSLKTGTRIIGGRDVELSAPLNEIPVHVRGGNILPRQGQGLTTNAARKNPFELIVALTRDSEGSGWSGIAGGSLYLDDSISQDSISNGKYSYIVFNATRNTISSTVVKAGYNPETDGSANSESGTLNKITIFGVQSRPSSVSIDGSGGASLNYDAGNMVATVTSFSVKLVQQFTIRFNY